MKTHRIKITTPELTAHLATVEWWQSYNEGRALEVEAHPQVDVPKCAMMELARAISWLAIPKRWSTGLYALPIEGGS